MNALAGRLHLDFRADDPLYVQIVRQIEALVAGGALRPGDQLPTVRELAIDLRINFSTVARAYRILDEQRLISTQRGRGTYIEDAGDGKAPEGPASPPETESRFLRERLAALAGRYIQEAAGAGAEPEQIEQIFQQQMAAWKRDHPHSSDNHSGG